jgi:bifunctional non-homologous end joining protein LigD
MPVSRSRPKSQRQYVFNSAALDLVRDLPAAKPAPMPNYIEPLFATLWGHPPKGDNWVHEIKYDGYRLQLHRSDSGIHAFTRRGHDWRDRFPSIVSSFADLHTRSVILDGEVVVVTPEGDTDFSALESYVSSKRADRSKHNVVLYAFDILYLDGFDLRDVALCDRKRVLRMMLEESSDESLLKYSEELDEDGPEVYRNACKLELEGIVSKKRDGRYRSGRNENWVKMTCRHRDTFLVAGIAYKGAKFDGVYLGQEQDGKLVYAGKVEHGFSDQQVKHLEAIAKGLEVSQPPIAIDEKKPKARWLKPVLLADVEYRRKTRRGLLRHPSYKGLREDLMEKPRRRRAA